ncbi:zinc-dependent metalloprotease [Plebeiibacterium sediminum]|uniref:Zinc-dependent metalloprotease n=1 Tax=Plebeiibacterium sediminum TaxID=2992112 RepID=A0AAE3M4L9_9BACT|nr:zinc-dependent metalloprotease [Plebeiobacterium sediminum]MCW3786565.1 zinc-dependent metalloprotease [Plebeiobacterium sediminum]
MKIYFILIALLISSFSLKASNDNSEKKSYSNGTIKPYEKVITPEYTTYSGMFTVHKSNDKLYFEIPDSLFMREFLIASQIAEVSDPNKGKGFAGELRRNPIVIQFSHDEKNVYLLTPSDKATLTKNSGNIKKAFERNYLTPVLETFPIKAIGQDSTLVIDVTDFFASELPIVTPFASKGKPGKLEKASSYLDKVQVFENNVELQSYFNYSTNTLPFRALINRSIVLLPKETMMPRLADRRMNYFSSSKKFFIDNGSTSFKEEYIHRFRLEPKTKDINDYLNGKLVEPKKPIIVYIDNGLPERWQKYVKLGIEDWQVAFEACGFKNAIQAKPFPDDPEFNPDNLQNTCFRYVPNNTINAMGTRWIDPRSGEILKGDIYWFADVIEKLHDWRLIQCGAVEAASHEKVFSDELMGRLIRYAVAHEMGHSLGFQHNMRASYAFPVDSLRSPSFTKKYGTTPSIMDYARNNYIAQPGDNVTELAPPLMGIYDIFGIKYGYQWLPDVENPCDEFATLNQWILDRADDPMYRFTPQFAMGISGDPAAQAEALGDDAVKAGTYGIKNLKIIMNNLVDWCTEPNKEYDYLRQIYKELTKQYERYLEHSMSYIGGAYQYLGVEGENIPLQTPVSKEKQMEAIRWVVHEMANSEWIVSKDIEDRVGSLKKDYYNLIVGSLDQMMSGYFFQRIETFRPNFTSEEYLSELSRLIWGLSKDGKLTETEIILQQSYVHNLINMAYGAKNHLKKESSSKLMNEGIDTESSLAAGNASKINYADHFVVMAALNELNKAEKYVKSKTKGAYKAHFALLYKTITTNK